MFQSYNGFGTARVRSFRFFSVIAAARLLYACRQHPPRWRKVVVRCSGPTRTPAGLQHLPIVPARALCAAGANGARQHASNHSWSGARRSRRQRAAPAARLARSPSAGCPPVGGTCSSPARPPRCGNGRGGQRGLGRCRAPCGGRRQRQDHPGLWHSPVSVGSVH